MLRFERSDLDLEEVATTTRSPQGRRLLCAHCGLHITDEGGRTAVQGGHEHFCTNPQGYQFHIGCFLWAGGCSAVGAPRAEHTWFSGFLWQVGVCRRCGVHLGWRFRNALGEGFYGLILAGLRRAEGG